MHWRRKIDSDRRADDIVVEAMEPRVLLSADALGIDAGVLDRDTSDHASWDLAMATEWWTGSADVSADAGDGQPVNGTDQAPRREIVFLDAGVADGDQLLGDLLGDDDGVTTQVYLIDASSDGVAQISRVLAGQQGIDAVHIISHGAAGQIQLGSGTLSTGSLDDYAGQLNDWGSALAESGDILIYGCDLAADAQGEALVDAIGILTGADVAASVDQTGQAAQGGDWDLEYGVGLLETASLAQGLSAGWQGVLAPGDTYLDEFNAIAYNGNNGTLAWANDWQEIGAGEPSGPNLGNVTVWNDVGERGLYLWAADNIGAWRQADLSSGASAALSFNWAMIKTEAGDSAAVQISTDGVVWDTLDTFVGPLDHSAMQSASYDISAYIDTDTRIRFVTLTGFSANDVLLVDNVKITLGGAAADNPPVFQSSGPFAVDENAAVGVVVGNIDADDGDGGAVDAGITYGITGNLDPDGDGTKAFWIDPATGEIRVNDAGDLDFEGSNPLVITVQADDGAWTNTVNVMLNLNDVNEAPTLGNNAISISQGAGIVLDSSMLSATDVDAGDPDSGLIFNVSGVSNGWFALITNTALPITSFTQGQVTAGDVVFLHDGGELAPAYQVSVTDGTLSTSASSGTVNFSGDPSGVLWLSTDGDLGASNGVPGLDATGWDSGDILQQAGPNLSFGQANTDGTFSIAFDVADFAPGANINGIHFVSSAITIGATNAITLQPGDLLLTTENDETFASNGALPEAPLAVLKEDIFFFRPDKPGDYSTGNFYRFLDDPFQDGGEIRALTLVEQDVWVGDVQLNAGDLLLARSGASEDNDIWLLHTATLDPTTGASYPAAQRLIEGDDVGVDIDQKIYGLDIVESDISGGGQSYDAGTILVALDADDTDGIGLTAQVADKHDIVALQVTKTTLGSGAGNAQVTATLMFDGDDVSGSDVNFESGQEMLDAITLTVAPGSVNLAPSLDSAVLTIGEGETVTLTAAMLSASDPDDADGGLVFTVSSVSGGRFELAGDPGVAVTGFTQAQIAAGDVLFVHDGNETAPAFSVAVSDGVTTTGPVAATINFANTNDAPVIEDASLAAVDEDTTDPSGATLGSLFGAGFADPDAGASLDGVAVIGNPQIAAEGVWQYSTDGSNWIAIGTVADDATALVLSAAAKVRFLPASDYNGTPGSLTLRGLDDTYAGGFSDTTGGTETRVNVDTGTHGSPTAIGDYAATLSTSINALNDAPTITSTAPTAATEDAVYSYTFTASDVDVGDTLTLSAPTLPAWLGFAPATGILSGTPTNAEVGTHSVVLRVNDGTVDVDQSFTITVGNTNDAPTITSTAPTAATEDAAYSYTFTASDVDVGDTLTLSAPTLPGWLGFNPATGILSGTPTNAEVGTHSVILRVNDGTVDVDQAFTITVGNTNDAPTLVNPIPDQAATEDLPFSFQFAAGTFNDADAGDSLSYTAELSDGSALPAWLNFDPATRTFSGTPDNDDVGTMIVRVIAADGSAAMVSDTFDLTVNNVNDAPVLGNNQMTLNAGDTVVLTSAMLSASDVDHPTGGLTFSVSGVSGGQFELLAVPGAAITSFTQAQVVAGAVVFVDDGDAVAPAYSVTVGDGVDSQGPAAASVTFGPPAPIPPVVPPPAPSPAPSPVIDAPAPVVTPSVAPPPEPAEDVEAAADETEPEAPADEAVATTDEAAAADTPGSDNALTDGAVPNINTTGLSAANPVQGLLQGLLIRPAALLTSAMPQAAVQAFEVDGLASEIRAVLVSGGFNDSLNRMRDGITDATAVHQGVVGSGIAVTTGLSVGYVAWLVRGGVLLSTALSSLPAWQFVDPLPVLARTRNNGDSDKGGDDSLEAIIKHEAEQAAKRDRAHAARRARVAAAEPQNEAPR